VVSGEPPRGIQVRPHDSMVSKQTYYYQWSMTHGLWSLALIPDTIPWVAESSMYMYVRNDLSLITR